MPPARLAAGLLRFGPWLVLLAKRRSLTFAFAAQFLDQSQQLRDLAGQPLNLPLKLGHPLF
jgi:hypothetical protein